MRLFPEMAVRPVLTDLLLLLPQVRSQDLQAISSANARATDRPATGNALPCVTGNVRPVIRIVLILQDHPDQVQERTLDLRVTVNDPALHQGPEVLPAVVPRVGRHRAEGRREVPADHRVRELDSALLQVREVLRDALMSKSLNQPRTTSAFSGQGNSKPFQLRTTKKKPNGRKTVRDLIGAEAGEQDLHASLCSQKSSLRYQ